MTALDRKSVEVFLLDTVIDSMPTSSFARRLTSAKNLRWTTQRKIDYADKVGYLDLCLLADTDVILAVENKINVGFTTHSISEGSQQAETIPQLEFYDRWLSDNCLEAALVLLTHLTDAPQGFLVDEGDIRSGRAATHKVNVLHRVCRWTTVYEWLMRWYENSANNFKDNPEAVFLRMLTREFLEFLENKNMSVADMESDDLELLDSFFYQDIWKKMRNLADSMRTLVAPLLPNLDVHRRPHPPPSTGAWEETQILWDWGYCYEQELEWYIGWGLSGWNGLRGIEVQLPTTLQAFVLISSDKAKIRLTHDELHACDQDAHQHLHEK
jgi:hypothetical protein